MSEDYHKWFARESTPLSWGEDNVPEMDFLLDEMITSTEALFQSMTRRWDETFAQPMTTSSGGVLHTPGEALTFNLAHDGIHLGYIFSLRHAFSGKAATL